MCSRNSTIAFMVLESANAMSQKSLVLPQPSCRSTLMASSSSLKTCTSHKCYENLKDRISHSNRLFNSCSMFTEAPNIYIPFFCITITYYTTFGIIFFKVPFIIMQCIFLTMSFEQPASNSWFSILVVNHNWSNWCWLDLCERLRLTCLWWERVRRWRWRKRSQSVHRFPHALHRMMAAVSPSSWLSHIGWKLKVRVKR